MFRQMENTHLLQSGPIWQAPIASWQAIVTLATIKYLKGAITANTVNNQEAGAQQSTALPHRGLLDTPNGLINAGKFTFAALRQSRRPHTVTTDNVTMMNAALNQPYQQPQARFIAEQLISQACLAKAYVA